MSDEHSIWSVPAYLPYLQPALTPSIIEETERTLGVKLPASYLELLQVQNGGYVRRTLPDTAHSMIWGIGPNYPSIMDEHEWQADAEDDELWTPRDADRLVPFDGDGHWYLCFDYRAAGPTEPPRISLIDLESESDNEVATSFIAFIAMLEEAVVPGTLGVINGSEDVVIESLQRTLRVTFEPADSFDHGYPIRRARIRAPNGPNWIWVSPNRVPRGFARPSEPRYAELSTLLPGTALRMPDHPAVTVVLESTPDVGNILRNACKQAGLNTVEIRAR